MRTPVSQIRFESSVKIGAVLPTDKKRHSYGSVPDVGLDQD